MMDVVKDNKLRLLFEYVEEEHQEYAYLELARSKHIDGMILLTPRLDDAGLRRLEEVEIPTVLMGEIEGSNLYTVDVDNHLAAQKAVQYLIELGHTQIACITNAPATYTASPDRVRGYKSALLNAGITPDEDLIRYADFTPESGYHSMRSLLASPKKFTAVFTEALLANRPLRAVSSAPVQISEALSKGELAALVAVGLSTERWPPEQADDPLTQSIVDYVALIETSLGAAEVARMLEVDVSRVRQRLREHSLFGVEYEGEWKLPQFQLERRKVLPGLATVLAALPAEMNALEVAEWFLSPNPDLEPEGKEKPLSPRDWLLRGLPAERVAELARGLRLQPSPTA